MASSARPVSSSSHALSRRAHATVLRTDGSFAPWKRSSSSSSSSSCCSLPRSRIKRLFLSTSRRRRRSAPDRLIAAVKRDQLLTDGAAHVTHAPAQVRVQRVGKERQSLLEQANAPIGVQAPETPRPFAPAPQQHGCAPRDQANRHRDQARHARRDQILQMRRIRRRHSTSIYPRGASSSGSGADATRPRPACHPACGWRSGAQGNLADGCPVSAQPRLMCRSAICRRSSRVGRGCAVP